MLLSNVIDMDYQNSCLFTNKDHFPSSLWVVIGVLAKFHEFFYFIYIYIFLFTSQYTSRSSSVVVFLWTIGAPSVQGSSQCPFSLLLPGLEPQQWQCQLDVTTP